MPNRACCEDVGALRSEWLYGTADRGRQNRPKGRAGNEAGPEVFRAEGHRRNGYRANPNSGPMAYQAMVEIERVTAAERRFSQSITLNNEITMLAAADELQAATREATVWRMANPCPDSKLGTHVAWMLTTCMEVAITAQRALTDRTADVEEAMGRLGLLLAVIDFHSQTLDAW